jgi:hypothetical protein
MRILALALSCLVVAPAAAKDITVTATPVPLNPNDPNQTTVDSLEYVAGFTLDSAAPEWGGYSGMVMAADGSSLLAVSDVGHWLKLELKHDATGTLTGVGAARIEPLLDEAGKPVAGKEWSDAEEVTQAEDGQFLVSFERRHRVWRYASVDGIPHGVAQTMAVPQAIGSLPGNSGIEAMMADSDGQLLLIAEGTAEPMRGSPGWIRKGAAWTEFAIARTDGFEPTSLSRSRNARPVLLERRYTKADGPAARISLLAMPPGDRVAGFALAVLRRPLTVDNFEALAVRPATDGRAFIYLLSDDNQSDRQRTLLLQFRARLD